MEPKYINTVRTYPTLSGDSSTDSALWGLAAALWEIARNAVSKQMSTSRMTSENPAQGEETNRQISANAEIEKLVLKPAEVVRMLGVSRGKVYEMVHTKEIPSIRIGKRIGIPRKALEKWIAEC